MTQKDILIFLSDQHTPLLSSYMGGPAKTPTMEQMAQNGINCTAAYTPCPLCVPARMSMLSGKLPSKTGILMNFDTLPNTTPTFVHSLAAAGYETVLIGRMHFVGADQRHGFQHRLVGDTTPVTWNRPLDTLGEIRGVFRDCFGEPHCTDLIGGGASPVLEYDKQVVQAALDWLDMPHEKPQFIVVGTYGPHFPYVASPEKYRYYKETLTLPDSFCNLPDTLDPVLRIRAEHSQLNQDEALQALAAYCGMIEETDEHLGCIRRRFFDFGTRHGRDGVLMYVSDHGDQCGERGLYGKMSFFEKSARIPWLIEGSGIEAGKSLPFPVSLMDMGPTICSLAQTSPPPKQDGCDILSESPALESRTVVSELYGATGAPQLQANPHLKVTLARMIRKGQYKLTTRHGYEAWDALFDLNTDPGETTNLIFTLPEVAAELRMYLDTLPPASEVSVEQEQRMADNRLLSQAEAALMPPNNEMWCNNPEEAKLPPQVV